MDKAKVRFIAMYLPQFHPIPENDEWWGKGFTEWTNVALAKPLFKGHIQPRVPTDLGFYDLRLSEVREEQARMAKEAGIEGFMYWHYWFGNGKKLLERPFEEVLKSGKPDYPFCLGWANHSWSRKTWTAKNNVGKQTMLLEQLYPGVEDYTAHFYDVLPAFKDKRYIMVDNKPFFLIYNCVSFPDLKLFIDTWQALAKENGLQGIHFVGNAMGYLAESKIDEILKCGVDAVCFSNSITAQNKASNGKLAMLFKKFRRKYLGTGPELYSYKKIIENIHSDYETLDNVYPCVLPGLDRTPRSGKGAVIYTGATPELFGELVKATKMAVENRKGSHKIIMINAWNEWGEGMYLEPDHINGTGYLDTLKRVVFEGE